MLATGSEQDCDDESDNRPEAYPPGKFHNGQPGGLSVKFAAENSGVAATHQQIRLGQGPPGDRHRGSSVGNPHRSLCISGSADHSLAIALEPDVGGGRRVEGDSG